MDNALRRTLLASKQWHTGVDAKAKLLYNSDDAHVTPTVAAPRLGRQFNCRPNGRNCRPNPTSQEAGACYWANPNGPKGI